MHRLEAVLVVEGQIRERRRLTAAEPDPDDPPGLVHREVDDLHRRGELVVANRLGGCLDHAARHIELPAVVDATQAVTLVAGEEERGAAMRTQLVEEADATIGARNATKFSPNKRTGVGASPANKFSDSANGIQ